MRKLIETATGRELNLGDVVKTFRGEEATLVDKREPETPASTGRVYVRFKDQRTLEPCGFYPSVIGAEWEDAGKDRNVGFGDRPRNTQTDDDVAFNRRAIRDGDRNR